MMEPNRVVNWRASAAIRWSTLSSSGAMLLAPYRTLWLKYRRCARFTTALYQYSDSILPNLREYKGGGEDSAWGFARAALGYVCINRRVYHWPQDSKTENANNTRAAIAHKK